VQPVDSNNDVETARARWLSASECASQLAAELFQAGSCYGDPDARTVDEHRLQSARHDAERFFREYHNLDRRKMELKLLELQRSQSLATWASFAVAAVVGMATVASTLVALFKWCSGYRTAAA
jgi:hypothetical protein